MTDDNEDLSELCDDAYAAVEEIDEILMLCDDLPDEAADFGTGIFETLMGIRGTIIERDHVSERQLTAIENIREGVERWLE